MPNQMNLLNQKLLKGLENKHKGAMGFVIGGGPSLHFQNVSALKKYVTISVNSGILKMPECDYFLSDDIGAKHWNYYQTTAKDSKCLKLLYEDKLKDCVSHFRAEEVIFFRHKWWYSPETEETNLAGLEMTKDALAPIIGARTSAASAVHFLYIMGCDPIVLLGCDSCYRKGKRYFWQFPGEPRAFRLNGEPVFCSANKGLHKGQPIDSHCRDFDNYWKQFAKQNKDRAEIIYASEGGIIDCFPMMTLNEVLEKYSEKIKDQ